MKGAITLDRLGTVTTVYVTVLWPSWVSLSCLNLSLLGCDQHNSFVPYSFFKINKTSFKQLKFPKSNINYKMDEWASQNFTHPNTLQGHQNECGEILANIGSDADFGRRPH